MLVAPSGAGTRASSIGFLAATKVVDLLAKSAQVLGDCLLTACETRDLGAQVQADPREEQQPDGGNAGVCVTASAKHVAEQFANTRRDAEEQGASSSETLRTRRARLQTLQRPGAALANGMLPAR